MDIRWQVLEQERHPCVDIGLIDDMVVVEHQIDHGLDGREFVHDGRENEVNGVLAGLQYLQPRRTNPRRHLLKSGDHIGPECRRLIVGLVQREPGHPSRPGRNG